MTDAQKVTRYTLENKKAITKAERVLLAALNDLRDAEHTGKDLEVARQAVVAAEKAVKQETKELKTNLDADLDHIAGGEDVNRVQRNQE